MRELKSILVPVNESAATRLFLPQVAALAARSHAAVTLLHAGEAPDKPEVYRRAAEFSQELERLGMRTSADHIFSAEPESARIVELTSTGRFDLVMVPGPAGHPAFRLPGRSTAERIARDCRSAVWTARGRRALSRTGFRHIVCALDLEADSFRVLRTAEEIAGQLGGTLSIVHAMPDIEEDLLALAALDELPPSLSRDKAESLLRKLKWQASSSAPVHLEIGRTVRAVRRLVRRLDADLLVVGPGRESRHAGDIGSNTRALLRWSPCPVLVVEKQWPLQKVVIHHSVRPEHAAFELQEVQKASLS